MTRDLCAVIRIDDEVLRIDFSTKFSLSGQLFDVIVIELRIVTFEVSHWRIEAAVKSALDPIDDKGSCDFVPSVEAADCTGGSWHLGT